MKKILFVAVLAAAIGAPIFLGSPRKVSIDDYPASDVETQRINAAMADAAKDYETQKSINFSGFVNPQTYEECKKQLAEKPSYWIKELCERIGQQLGKEKGI